MRYAILLLVFFFSIKTEIAAQPPICGANPLMTPLCSDACIICDIDGYSGNNNSVVSGVGPPSFCTFIQHNIQWIGFVATSVNLTLEISVSNCFGGGGLEVAIYESFDCISSTLVSQCLGGTNGMQILNGTSGSISNTVPLVIGQYYYFVMDGHAGAVCDYTVNVTAGSTQVPPLSPIPAIYGDLVVCPGGPFPFSIDPILGAPQVDWTVDGTPVAFGENVDIVFNNPGVSQLCVEASNVCNPPVTLCTTVQVVPIPQGTHEETICLGDCVTIGNQSLCTQGIFPITLTSYQGCDSVVNVTVNTIAPINTIMIEEICEGESVMFGTQTLSQSGVYNQILNNYQGCDSTVVLTLIVLPGTQSSLTEEICDGNTYTLGGENFDETGNYQVTFMIPGECDSLVNLDLTVLPILESFLSEEICEGDSYELGNQTFNQIGTYQVLFQDQNGCDSLVNLDLMVVPPLESFLTEEICDGAIFTVGMEDFTATGSYQIALLDQNGCDSLVNLDLMVVPPLESFLAEEICDGAIFTVGMEDFTATGNYQITLLAQNGCDSLVNLDLNVTPIIETPLSTSICDGDIYFNGNQMFTIAGQYQIAFIAASGCDSLVNLDLEVLQFLETNLIETICDGDSIQVGNQTFDQTGIYSVNLTANSGCDSIVNLDLSVNLLPTTNLIEEICEGDSIQIGDQFFNENGQFEILLTANTGCDSTVFLDLQTIHPNEFSIMENICDGDTYTIENQTFDTAGDFEIFLNTVGGCDSIISLNLGIIPIPNVSVSAEICEDEIFQIGSETFNQTGQYEVILTSALGCDSLVTLDLEVLQFLETALIENICEGGIFQVGNEAFNQTGEFQIILTSQNNCDSIISLDLTVFELPETFLAESICEGEVFPIGNEIFDQTGNYEVVLSSLLTGCDSIISLDLNVILNEETFLVESICEGEAFPVGNDFFNQSGDFEVVLSTIANCDSTVYLNLTVIPPVQENLIESICDGDTYSVDNESFGESGQFEIALQSFDGCDSLVTLNLTVFENPITTLNEEICESETFEVGGEFFDSEGQFSVPLTAISGCDSTVILNLIVNDAPESFLQESICEGEIVTIGSEIFSQTGAYQIPFSTAFGCDSIVYLDLEVFPVEQTVLNEIICENEIYTVGNQDFNQTGTYQVLLNTYLNCDSIVDLNLTVINFDTTNLVEEICAGESFEMGGQFFDVPGVYQVVLSAFTSCDSIVNLDLTVTPCEVLANINEDNLDCHGDTNGSLTFTVSEGTPPFQYDWELAGLGIPSGMGTVNGLGMSGNLNNLPAGNYEITITDVNDFEVILNSVVNEPPELGGTLDVSQFGNLNLPCHGDETGFLNAIISGGTSPYQYQWNSGAETANLENIGAGNYAVTIIDQNNCSLILEQSLLEPAVLSFDLVVDQPDCLDELGLIEIQNTTGGVPFYQYNLNNGNFSPQALYDNLPAGNYSINIQDANGCSEMATMSLVPVPPFFVDLGDDLNINLGNDTELQANFSFLPDSVVWEGNGLSCFNCLEPFVQPLETSTYILTAFISEGCIATDEITVFVEKDLKVYIPNAFSPNNDGINDIFMVFGGPEVLKINTIQVFSRWGETIFQYYNIPPNDIDFGWDGKHRGKELNSGIFIWFAEVEFIDGTIELFKGDVALVR